MNKQAKWKSKSKTQRSFKSMLSMFMQSLRFSQIFQFSQTRLQSQLFAGRKSLQQNHLQQELYVFFFPVILNFFLLDLGNLRIVVFRLLYYCLLFFDRNWDGDSSLRISELECIWEEIAQNLAKTVFVTVNLADQRQVLHSVNVSM